MSKALSNALAALQVAMNTVEETAREAGALGVPSGVAFAALSSMGMTHGLYVGMIEFMQQQGIIKVVHHVIYALPKAAAEPRRYDDEEQEGDEFDSDRDYLLDDDCWADDEAEAAHDRWVADGEESAAASWHDERESRYYGAGDSAYSG